jgi:hypothetical protein
MAANVPVRNVWYVAGLSHEFTPRQLRGKAIAENRWSSRPPHPRLSSRSTSVAATSECRCRRGGRGSSGRQHLEQMTVRVAEVEPAAAVAVIDLHILRRARPAAISDSLGVDPVEDPVELIR